MAYITQMDAGPDLLLTMNKCSLPPCPSPPASPPAPISGSAARTTFATLSPTRPRAPATRCIVSNKKSGFYDGCKNAVALATELAASSEKSLPFLAN